jgi:hypothetical protein
MRVATDRRPNIRLRALISEASWTGQGLARAVNGMGAETGLVLCYDRTAVSHWLAGVRPAPHIAALVAEALSRKLGRSVTVHDTDLSVQGKDPAAVAPVIPSWEGNGVARLIELCAADADPVRRALLRGSVYSVAALAIPAWVQPPPVQRPRVAGDAWIGAPQAETVEVMTGMFSAADTAFGGGHIRGALTAYLSGDVSVWLRARAAPAVRRRLLIGVTELTYLAAFVCFDSQLHGLAQRYYLTAMRLASQAEEPALYATVARGMSVQAYSLGHYRESLHLAETAAQACDVVPGAKAASLAGQLAVAAAATGDRRGALAQLGAAERHLERGDTGDGPLGSYHRAALAHQHAEVLAAGGDRSGAINALTSSIRRRPAGERRSRAITTARLAGLQLDAGHLEAACATGERFCEDYPYLHSARADGALRSLHARLRPYQRNTDARALLERIRPMISTGSHGSAA